MAGCATLQEVMQAMGIAAVPVEALPFVWIGAFAVLLALHFVLHPQARLFRDALRWLGEHPAPLLWLMASLMAGEALAAVLGTAPHPESTTLPATAPWPDAFGWCVTEAWRRLALVFHAAVMPPLLAGAAWWAAAAQSLVSATAQTWLCCYFAGNRGLLSEATTGVRETVQRWRFILVLALCHFPWWWAAGRDDMELLRTWLLPEFFLFLAPVPLAAAVKRVDFLEAGTVALQWWSRCWGKFLLFCASALVLLVLMEFCLRMLPGLLPSHQVLVRTLLESVVVSSLHVWLFVSAALLLLRGGYVPGDAEDG